VSAIPPQSAADSFAVMAPDNPAQALSQGKGTGPAGSWQQAAGIFSAIADMLSSGLTGRQSRAHLIEKLGSLEMKLRNGEPGDSDSLKSALIAIEAELRALRKMQGKKASVTGLDSRTDTGAPAGAEALARELIALVSDPSPLEAAAEKEPDVPFVVPETTQYTAKLRFQAGCNAQAEQGATVGGEPPFRHASTEESAGLREEFGNLAPKTLETRGQAQPGGAANCAELAGPPIGIERSFLDALTQEIEASHRQLAARVGAGLSTAVKETKICKETAGGAAQKIEPMLGAHQSQAGLDHETTSLAGRLDRAGEGLASLSSLEHAMRSLCVQLEETCKIAGRLGMTIGDEPPAGTEEASSRHRPDGSEILREIVSLRAAHEDVWQRVHLTLSNIQQSVDEIAKAAWAKAGIQGVVTSPDPFAPILTSLAQRGPDGSLAAQVISSAASEKDIRSAATALSPGRIRTAGKLRSGTACDDEDMDNVKSDAGEGFGGGFLIEPGHGFPHRAGESGNCQKMDGERNAADDHEEMGTRTDFIAAARRAARQAQGELQGKEAKPALRDASFSIGGFAKLRSLSLRRPGLSLPAPYKRALVLGSMLLFSAIGAFAVASTLPQGKVGGMALGFLKQLDWRPAPAKPAAAETPAMGISSRSSPGGALPAAPPARPPAPNEPASAHPQASEPHADAPAARKIPAIGAAALMDPLAPVGLSAQGAVRFTKPASEATAPARRAIAGSSGIVAGTLGRGTAASDSGWPGFITSLVPANNLPRAATAGAPPPQAGLPAAGPEKNLLEEAKSGDAAAQFELAARYAEGSGGEQNYELAAQWYSKAAEQGLAVAEFRLASLYERGLGVRQDFQQAKTLYQRAAERGNTRAMHNLGVLAIESNDGKPNYTSAALWFGKAAEYGIRDSQYNLAVLLARGLGVPKDLVKSYTWFAIVAASGDADAARKRDEVAARLTASELAAANAAAAAFKPHTSDRAANEIPPLAVHQDTVPATPRQPVRPKVSGL